MSTTTRPARRGIATKVVASIALLAGAASVAGLGTFGAFTDTTTADQKVSTGTIDLNGPDPTVFAPVKGLVAGDWIERPVTLTRAANTEGFGSLTLATKVIDVKGAVTNPANLPTLTVDMCTEEWGLKPGTKELTCPDEKRSAVATGQVLGTFSLNNAVPALNDVSTAYLRVTLRLPESAGNDFQDASATLKLTFTATQRGGKPV